MPIISLQTSENKCDICNFVFKTQNDLKEHFKISKNCSPVSSITLQERTFNYNLTTAKAKSNLLKSARREPYELVHHQKCVKILFNAGLYKIVLLPLLSAFEHLEPSGPLSANIINIKLVSLVPGTDISGNIVDTKVELDVNNQKVTLHAYNTTQNVKVEGAGYLILVERFLEPLLSQKSKELEAEIEDVNNEIIDKFGQSNQKLRNFETWKDRMSKNFICANCDFATTNKIGLKTHITRKHMKSSTISTNIRNSCITYTNISPKHQTRDHDVLMIEDISITNIDDGEEVTVNEIECKEIKHPSLQTSDSDINKQIEDLPSDKMDPTKDKDTGKVETNVATEVKHIETIDETSSGRNSSVLIEDSTFYCSICAKSFELRESLDKHLADDHGNTLDVRQPYDKFPLTENNHEKLNPIEHMEKLNGNNKQDSKCQKCDKVIRTKSGRNRHLETFCEQCEKCLPERISFNIHNEVYHVNSCSKCNLVFDSTLSLEWHRETEHETEIVVLQEIKCKECNQDFLNKSSLTEHMERDHNSQEPTKCEESRNKLSEHSKNQHVTNFTCNECETLS